MDIAMRQTTSAGTAAQPAVPIRYFQEKLLFHTCDLDEARDKVSDVYKSHVLDYNRYDKALNTWFFHIPVMTSSINYLGYGSEMLVNPGELESFFLIQTPLSGGSEVHCGKQSLATNTRQSSVLNPTEAIKMIWQADCWKAQVKLDRSVTERCLSQLLERPLTEPLVFTLGMDLQSDAGRVWWKTVNFVAEEIRMMSSMPHAGNMARQLEQLLVNTLLHVQPHNYSGELCHEPPNIAPRHVKRAEEYISNYYKKEITSDDLVRVSGVSARSLYQGFQKFRGISPMKLLKATRLDEVNKALTAADSGDCVTRIATDCGFSQLGRFAVEYRQRFGESPSETLKR
jgi:AraC-like DNA-binding protein